MPRPNNRALNPIPVKAALAVLKMIEPVYRLPMSMVPPQPKSMAKIKQVLEAVGLCSFVVR